MINKVRRGRWRGEERVECGGFKENCDQMTVIGEKCREHAHSDGSFHGTMWNISSPVSYLLNPLYGISMTCCSM
jgi:hypothetical protein